MRSTPDPRSNADWLAELRHPERSEAAVQDLRTYLRGALLRMLGARAQLGEADLDDFAQEAILRILQGLDGFRGDARFTTWATAVAVRTALGALRRRRPVSLEELGPALAEPTAPAQASQDAEREALLEALRRTIRVELTERQRIAVLGLLSGMAADALLAQLGTNPNALYKLYHDARKKLKRALNAAGYSDEDVRKTLSGSSERT